MPHNDGPDRTNLALRLVSAPMPDPDEMGMAPTPESEGEPSGEEGMEADSTPSGRQGALMEAYRRIKEEHGEWTKTECGYEPISMRGQKCGGCTFYEEKERGKGACELVEGMVDSEAVCNFYIGGS